MHQRLVRSLARSLGGFATLASTGRSARTCATWSAATAARGASAAEGALRAPDRASSFGPSPGFAAFGALRNAAPPASTRGQVRGKTKGVGVHVGADECQAMKEENGGEEVDSGAFGQRQEKGDFENLLDKMLDTQKVFFVGPSSNMKKAEPSQ